MAFLRGGVRGKSGIETLWLTLALDTVLTLAVRLL